MTSLRRLSLLVLVLSLLGLVAACGSGTTTHRAVKEQCSYPTDGRSATKKASLPPGNPPTDLPTALTISTNQGDVKIALDAKDAPCSVNSFVSLAKQGYFDNTVCHRLVTASIYVLQCGDPGATGKPGSTTDGQGGPGYRVPDELVPNDPRLQPCQEQQDASGKKVEVCTYTTGTVAMANAGPDTTGSQFFLVYQDSPLPNAYTVIGKMSAAGVNVVKTVAKAGAYPPDTTTGNTPPKLPVQITSVK